LSGEATHENLGGYTGKTDELLRDAGARRGSRIKIRTKDGFEVMGLVIPAYEEGSGEHLVLKLKSGYNIGIDSSSIESLSVLEEPFADLSSSSIMRPEQVSASEKTVLLLSTGGTIASKVDYRTGAVKPAYTASDLYSAVPELGRIAQIKSEVIFSALSENLAQEHWQKLSEAIIQKSTKDPKFDGIVIMLGTDTMGYFSAALSFSLIGLNRSIVCVGSQRSSDRPSSDSALNLQAATRFAAYSKVHGVFVAMHKTEADGVIAIHSGVRVRKNHTSRRDAFESIDIPIFAEVDGEKITINFEFPDHRPNFESLKEFRLKPYFDKAVSLVKFHPGLDPLILDYLTSERGIKGVILEGTGLGHVSNQTVRKARELVARGVFVGMTSQCIRGHVDLHVYETGIDLLKAGVIPLGNMISETALAKLSWVLGNFPGEDVGKLMTRNLLGELTERILIK
jgi:glutamyl-tRNA(Gln) amidotransferase subunit D